LVLPVIDVLHELLAIAVSNAWVSVPHPVINQDLPYLTALQNGFTETPENIEQRPRLISAHLLENEVEIVPADAAWIEYGCRACFSARKRSCFARHAGSAMSFST
jgi:hypothetical protein